MASEQFQNNFRNLRLLHVHFPLWQRYLAPVILVFFPTTTVCLGLPMHTQAWVHKQVVTPGSSYYYLNWASEIIKVGALAIFCPLAFWRRQINNRCSLANYRRFVLVTWSSEYLAGCLIKLSKRELGNLHGTLTHICCWRDGSCVYAFVGERLAPDGLVEELPVTGDCDGDREGEGDGEGDGDGDGDGCSDGEGDDPVS